MILSPIFDTNGQVYSPLCAISPFCQNEKTFIESVFHINFNNKMLGPPGVPFMFKTDIVNTLINDIEQKVNDKFVNFFLEHTSNPPRVTEFVLYSGYILYKFNSYDVVYNNSQKFRVWNLSDWEVSDFDHRWNYFIKHIDEILTASIHRRAYSALSDNQKNIW